VTTPGRTEREAPKMDKQAKAQLYVDYLKGEGYQPEIDGDGDVRFKSEGRSYFISVDENDDSFFRVCFPNFWPIENEEERVRVHAACDHSNRRSKVAKVFTVRDDVWASLELFVATPEGFKPLFTRCMAALQNGVRNFVDKMREGARA
jgi:hypothetical protein